jgi:hypothetical protein
LNAFTQKPDISKFIKDAKHSHHSSKLGRQMAENPTPEQRYFFEEKRKPKSKPNQETPKDK